MREANLSAKRYLKRGSRMVRELFGGSLPIFIASIISRAMMSFISLLAAGDTQVAISVTFIYAFCFLQTLGVAITVRVDHASIIFPYTLHVVTEVTGFAWKEFVTLIMLKWLFEHKLVGAAIGAWLLILFIAFSMVYVFNAALALYFKPSPEIFEGLRDFNTDALSLAIAFSFTLIAASFIYPSESAGTLATSDSEHAIDIPDGGKGSAAYIFLAYSFAITFIIATLTWKLAPLVNKQGESDEFVGHVGFGAPLDGEEDGDVVLRGGDGSGGGHVQGPPTTLAAAHAEALKASEEENETFFRSIDSVDPGAAPTALGLGVGVGVSGGGASNAEIGDTSGGTVIRPTHSVAVLRHGEGLSHGGLNRGNDDIFSSFNHSWSYLDNLLFAWDPNGYSKSSLAHLINTSGGYTVGCAWYTFSLLTFQNLFSALTNGRLLGLFLYAITMTAIVVLLMERIEKRQSRIWARQLAVMLNQPDQRTLSAYRSRYKRNSELIRVAGRLLCGWSWADFVTVCADTAITDTETAEMTSYHSSSWLQAVLKSIIAFLFFGLGACYVRWRHRIDEASARRMSLSSGGGGGGSRNSSRGLSLQEHREKHAALQAEYEAAYGDEGYFEEEGAEGGYSVLGSNGDVDIENPEGYQAPLLAG